MTPGRQLVVMTRGRQLCHDTRQATSCKSPWSQPFQMPRPWRKVLTLYTCHSFHMSCLTPHFCLSKPVALLPLLAVLWCGGTRHALGTHSVTLAFRIKSSDSGDFTVAGVGVAGVGIARMHMWISHRCTQVHM